MANPYYNHASAQPATSSSGSSAVMRTEFDAITAGFNILPSFSISNAGQPVVVNSTGTALINITTWTFDVTNNLVIASGNVTLTTGNLVLGSGTITGLGTGLTGTASGLTVGTATNATNATTATTATTANGLNTGNSYQVNSLGIGTAASGVAGTFVAQGSAYTVNNVLTYGATTTVNCQLSNSFRVVLTGNITTLSLTNPQNGQTINIRFKQDAAGSRTVAWPASFRWANGAAPALTTGVANAEDFLTAQYDSTDATWVAALMKGVQ